MENMRLLRKEKGITLTELAKLLGTSRQVLSRYELGQAEASYEMLIKLASFFDCSVDYLIGHSTYYYPDRLAYSESGLSDSERELVACFRKMPAGSRENVLSIARTLAAHA